MGDTVRNLGRRARTIRARGGRGARLGLILIAVGALLLVAAVIGALAVNL